MLPLPIQVYYPNKNPKRKTLDCSLEPVEENAVCLAVGALSRERGPNSPAASTGMLYN